MGDTAGANGGDGGAAVPKVTTATVEKLLAKAFPHAASMGVKDVSGGCGTSFKVTIVSPAFEGHRLLARQRLVYTALAPVMPDIHAVLMTLKTPSQVEAADSAATSAAAPAASAVPTPSGE
ncbi:hypothetical protein MMPV_004871 [Pyropia vietnamensis]